MKKLLKKNEKVAKGRIIGLAGPCFFMQTDNIRNPIMIQNLCSRFKLIHSPVSFRLSDSGKSSKYLKLLFRNISRDVAALKYLGLNS